MKPTLSEKISSLQQSVGGVYRRPSQSIVDLYIKQLSENPQAMDYLKIDRNLTDETIQHFRLGFDVSKNAISIPVYKRGELINIRYRFLDKESKIRYSQEKDCEVWLYHDEGIDYGKKSGGVLIVEGEFDLMSVWQSGIKNVVSPASGKDSYGPWLELIDSIPKVYIAYDNDKPGKEAGIKLSERVGVEKCRELFYPEGVKDANDYFKKYTGKDYKELLKQSRPYYSYQFKGVADVINDLRFNDKKKLELTHMPEVKLGEDWLVVVSGESNIGKTSYVMNLAEELMAKNMPSLILPFERGPQVVGTRYLQVKYNLGEGDFSQLDQSRWDEITKECVGIPLYFAMPGRDEVIDVIKKAKRIFDVKVVIIDHLDYMVRNSTNKEAEIGNTLQTLKRVAEENKILMIIVHHIRKIKMPGSTRKAKPSLEDLKGSSSLYQDPECVVMLSSEEQGILHVDIAKNKGKMSKTDFKFNVQTGKIGVVHDDFADFKVENQQILREEF